LRQQIAFRYGVGNLRRIGTLLEVLTRALSYFGSPSGKGSIILRDRRG
jgi:hypothetical protein